MPQSFHVALFIVFTVNSVASQNFSDKVAPELQTILSRQANANIAITFEHGTSAIFNQINNIRFTSRGEKITFLIEQLESWQNSSQKGIQSYLATLPNTKSYYTWINNMVYVENATLEIIQAISEVPEVSKIREQIIAFSEKAFIEEGNSNKKVVEWGVERIEADKAWTIDGGNSGEGVVVGLITGGVMHSHEALQSSWRSNYGWLDTYHKTTSPSDETGIGTSITGIITGSNGIGVSPGAEFITCKGCLEGNCTEVNLIVCAEWILCPTLPDGTLRNCSLAPEIVVMAFYSDSGDPFFDVAMEAFNSVGIIPIAGIGSNGNCSSTTSPGDRPGAIGVGFTDQMDFIHNKSSKGPSGNITKPDVTAPGVDIRTASYTFRTDYVRLTSANMAVAHVAGAVALLLSYNPDLRIDQVRLLLGDNAERALGETEACGGTPFNQFPNNIYGYGRINARASLEAAMLPMTVEPTTSTPETGSCMCPKTICTCSCDVEGVHNNQV